MPENLREIEPKEGVRGLSDFLQKLQEGTFDAWEVEKAKNDLEIFIKSIDDLKEDMMFDDLTLKKEIERRLKSPGYASIQNKEQNVFYQLYDFTNLRLKNSEKVRALTESQNEGWFILADKMAKVLSSVKEITSDRSKIDSLEKGWGKLFEENNKWRAEQQKSNEEFRKREIEHYADMEKMFETKFNRFQRDTMNSLMEIIRELKGLPANNSNNSRRLEAEKTIMRELQKSNYSKKSLIEKSGLIESEFNEVFRSMQDSGVINKQVVLV